jgi:NAD(P)-dependent dehydrogenase (short-subunit alcohol dehydrogenase family)
MDAVSFDGNPDDTPVAYRSRAEMIKSRNLWQGRSAMASTPASSWSRHDKALTEAHSWRIGSPYRAIDTADGHIRSHHMRLLEDKVCVITGGAGSVGLATARRFIAEGARVMLVDLSADALERSATMLGPGRVATQVCDVTNAGQVQAYIAATQTSFGPIDVLFSNAGDPGHIASPTEYPEDAFDHTISVHAKGAFLACKYGLPAMRDGGSIIITSSLAGVRGGGGINVGYVAAKHAQIGIMRAVSRFAATRGIRVNTVNPGPVDNAFQTGIEVRMENLTGVNVTEQLNQVIPLKRHARVDEIASAVLYFASDLSTYVTGTVHMIDGGLMS